MGQLIIIVAMLALMWFLLIRPQRQRQVTQNRMLASLSVGDEIVTAGGLYGFVRGVEEDDLEVEIAPSVVVRIARRAVATVFDDEDEADEEELAEAAAEDAEAVPADGSTEERAS